MLSSSLRDLFLIPPDITYLNHGAFGAMPLPVMREHQRWQVEIERQPTEMIGRRVESLRRTSLEALALYLNASVEDLVYIPTATMAVNMVARSLKLGPGDEVLSTDHEFGACERAWRAICDATGATYRAVPLPLPVTTHEEMIARLFASVTPATRAIFISHITSATALTFPVAAICREARERGLFSVVDGAHAPGQVPLDLEAIGADIYIGILHKWLCAPKGTAFLHARRSVQSRLEPLVRGWDEDAGEEGESILGARHQNIGLTDMSPFLTVPSAIEFQREHRWDEVRRTCHELVRRARPLIAGLLGAEPAAPDDEGWYAQMSAFLLPASLDGALLQRRLYEKHRIEIPVMSWNGRGLLRLSMQGYNGWEDIERLLEGVEEKMRMGA
jgi:isopenicillin-N epimerase